MKCLECEKLKLQIRIMKLKPKLDMIGYTWEEHDNMKLRLKKYRRKLQSLRKNK